jgi:hypothetical protein
MNLKYNNKKIFGKLYFIHRLDKNPDNYVFAIKINNFVIGFKIPVKPNIFFKKLGIIDIKKRDMFDIKIKKPFHVYFIRFLFLTFNYRRLALWIK